MVPLWAPYYGASISIAFRRFWRKYADFSGRASRSEFWWWALCAFLSFLVLQIVFEFFPSQDGVRANGTIGVIQPSVGAQVVGWLSLVWLASLAVPTIALSVRRLHDANFRGWFLFLAFVPLAGPLIILVLTVLPTRAAGQRFDRPKDGVVSRFV